MTCLAPAFVILGIAMVRNATPPAPEAGPPPLAELARLARQGRLDGVTIEYWVGGGLPPPLRRSDQFRLLTVENRDILELARPYHDPAAKLEGLIEKFQLAADPSDVRRLAKLILDTGVFEPHSAGEKDTGPADALTTEVIVSTGGREFKRRYLTGAPKPLEPLRAEVEHLIQRLVARGTRGVFHQGKSVTLPRQPAQENAGRTEVNPETIPVSKLVEEVGRRIDRRLAAQGKLALWLRVGDHATAEESATADAVKRALQTKPGIVFSKQTVAGAVPVPSGTPGGHVHMRIYAFEPHPDLVLDIGELDGSVCVAAREAGRDPMAPAQSWIWILRAQ